nr:class I SAM-dependent methyltransferase [Kribbella amoyensis]
MWEQPHFAYDEDEAAKYDETRGGPDRARAAALAVHELLGSTGGRVLELAVGTGIVGAELVALGNLVHGVDLSPAMLRRARIRLPGHVAAADAAQLPFADRRCDAVVAVWLLHLLADSDAVLAEVARVLRPGGVFVTTAEKSEAGRVADGRTPKEGRSEDSLALLVARAARYGLVLDGATTFVGHNQARGTTADPVYPVARFRRVD